MFIEILFKILLFKGSVLIYAEHCINNVYMYIYIYIYTHRGVVCGGCNKSIKLLFQLWGIIY